MPQYGLPSRKELGDRILKTIAETAEQASNANLRERQEETGGRFELCRVTQITMESLKQSKWRRARLISALRWPNIVFLRCFAHDVNNLGESSPQDGVQDCYKAGSHCHRNIKQLVFAGRIVSIR
ncbi:hypothetical protein F443_08715 [Phytophthora nicotianae P1569]|uniref:Uncharacterized protein n=2 Tax=Phytophthora nicotianae TaxID=4792 RepID=V9F622_PHYNI|nr:hypothetical protein F443_08715 [Phytophthora nicotianae P1569]ETO71839.1 hypothetical protein F444_11882 [Phytophthora nicotianae P1976]